MTTPSRRGFLKLTAAAGLAMPAALARPAEAVTVPPPRLRKKSAREATLVLAGDLFLMEAFPAPVAPGTAAVLEVVRGADASIANLENGLSTVGSPELGGFRYGGPLRAHPRLVGELEPAGITAVSLANNHTGNYGAGALLETMRTLDGARIHHAGAGADIERAFAPTLFEAGGLRIALVSVYSYYYNFGATDNAGDTTPGVAGCRTYDVAIQLGSQFGTAGRDTSPYLLDLEPGPSQVVLAPLQEDLDRMAGAIESARDRADITVLSVHIHWGRHTRHDLPVNQRVLAHRAIDAGADVVVGHGPHTLRGIELYHGKPVFYSLGNFVLQRAQTAPEPDAPIPPAREALIVRATVEPRAVRAIELVPIVIGLDGQPRLATGAAAVRILSGVAALSAGLGSAVEQDGWIGTVALS